MIKRVILIGIVFLMLCLCIQPGFAGVSNANVVKNITDLSVAGNSPGNSTVQDIVINVTPMSSPIPVLTATPGLTPTTILSENQTVANQGTPGSSCPSCGFVETYPLMHFTSAQLDEMQTRINAAPKYSAPRQALTRSGNLPTGSKSLLSYLLYTPSERNQGQCGNCWVWASTGALEIDHTVTTGIKDRLSIQYFNSKYNNGVGSSWACCGGWLSYFTDWYNTDKTPIPWSNTNAGYGDASSQCSRYATAVPLSLITTRPSYTMSSISSATISTYGAGQSTAVNNIKSALNENKAVVYSFYYGDTGWNAFDKFWDYSNETYVFDPTPYNNETETGGHAVLVVGYDDTDPGNPYWIVLNSWGSSSNRPNVLFRQTMNINYSATVWSEGALYQQHTFEIVNSTFVTSSPVANFTATPTSGTAPLTVTFTDSSTNTPTSWSWLFGDGGSSTLQNPSHIYSSAGNYTVSLTATNSIGSNTLTRTNYISVTENPASEKSTIGMYRGDTYYLRNSNTAGPADLAFVYGATGDVPVTGHWEGLGTDTIGVYRNGVFYLRNSNSAGPANRVFAFGTAGDTPVTGDWSGSGASTIGIYRNGVYYLRFSNTAGPAELTFAYGSAGDIPVTGDWTGTGADTIGVYRNGVFYLRNSNTAGPADLAFAYGVTGDIPVTGDWNGDGITTIGVYRNGVFYLRNTNTAGPADLVFAYGSTGDIPVTGKWV